MLRRFRLLCLYWLHLLLVLTALPVVVALAQEPEPLPTLVITQPTPFATPRPGAEPSGTPIADAAATPALSMHEGAVTEGATAYRVREGDTLLSVALEMGLDVEEMGCVTHPDFDPAQPLVIGDLLEPLPPGYLCHTAEAGESVRDIATIYGVNAATILGVAWNALGGDEYMLLDGGRSVRVPHVVASKGSTPVGAMPEDSPFLAWMLAQPATLSPQQALGGAEVRRYPSLAPVPSDWVYGSGYFMWPTYGWLTQGYRSDHRAIDIAAPAGSPVTASDRGVVLRAGWNNQGYGNFVIVDHNIDYLTLYAHMSDIFVSEGEVVAQGQILGTVGSTGNSTGPHLHFEIRDFGRLANPLEFLAH